MTARSARRTPRVPPAVVRLGARELGRRCLNPSLPWPVQRTRLDQLSRTFLLPRNTTITERAIAGLRTEVIATPTPPSGSRASPRPTVLHFHGGGYCIGSPLTPRSWAAHLAARTGARVVLPEYRLAPEHPHPAALDDACALFAALREETWPAAIIVSGDSAGAGLTLALLLQLRDASPRDASPRDAGPRDAGQALPAGAILLSPWLDLTRDRRADPALVRRDVLLTPGWLDACARAYAAPSAWPDPSISPLHARHAGLPKLLIQAGTHELLAPEAGQLAARAAAAGVDVTYSSWPRLWHDFMLQPGLLAAADSAVAQAAWFVAQVAQVAQVAPSP